MIDEFHNNVSYSLNHSEYPIILIDTRKAHRAQGQAGVPEGRVLSHARLDYKQDSELVVAIDSI
jgi:hypothetical protein